MQNQTTDEMSSERQFLENLLNTRVNFVVVVFSLACTAVAALDSQIAQIAVLGGSTILTGLLAMACSRIQYKFDLVFEKLGSNHPARIIDDEAAKQRKSLSLTQDAAYGRSRRHLIGHYIPWLATFFLLLGTIAIGKAWAESTLEARLAEAVRKELDKSSESAVSEFLLAARRRDSLVLFQTRSNLDSVAAKLSRLELVVANRPSRRPDRLQLKGSGLPKDSVGSAPPSER
jgi:hypothetical protein